MANHQRSALTPFVISNLKYIPILKWDFACGHLPGKAHNVGRDFFGICAASSPDPACDDYVIAGLRQLKAVSVWVAFTYTSADSYPDCFLHRLVLSGLNVSLPLVH